jgi:hypothetical protein
MSGFPRISARIAREGAYSGAERSIRMARHQIALFTFTLGNSESIGPAALRDMWVRACGTSDVSVGRRAPAESFRDRPVYTLYAPQDLADVRDVELRLRRMFESAHLHASLTTLHA